MLGNYRVSAQLVLSSIELVSYDTTAMGHVGTSRMKKKTALARKKYMAGRITAGKHVSLLHGEIRFTSAI
jgi:hypothetical protein